MAQNAATELARTLTALDQQTRLPERRVVVTLESRDDTYEVAAAAKPDLCLRAPEHAAFGEAVRAAVQQLARIDGGDAARIRELGSEDAETPNDWLWILGPDNTPEPQALAELLDTTERNPSLEITGPKLVRADDPAVLVEYGESVTRAGTAVHLNADALDQGQFEHLSDVLGVAAHGMLVRRDTWDRLGGFDPGLEAVDEGLDLSVRTWLSGGRVLLSPGARVESAGEDAPGTTRLNNRSGSLRRYRIRRAATLHRNLVWAGWLEFIVRWLGLLPAALVRTILHLVRKSPGRILPDLRVSLSALFLRGNILTARKQFRATQTQPRAVLERLLVSGPQWRKLQASRRDEYRAAAGAGRERYNFITGGGGWVLLLAVLAAGILRFPLFNAGYLSGGGLLPLPDSIGDLWGATGYGLRDTGGGIGVADPFALVIAVLGTLTFWQPSLAIVGLWLLALPLAAVGGWYLAARFTRSPWLRVFAGILWFIAPPLHEALALGNLPGVLVHLALPWLFFTMLAAPRSWAAAGVCALLALVVAASAPMLLPALVVLWLVGIVRAGRGWVRILFVAIPAAVMFAPLAMTQLRRGHPIGLFADPSVPLPLNAPRGWHVLALTGRDPAPWWGQWLADTFPGADPWLVLVVLLAPLAVLAVIGVFGRGWRVAIAGILAAACGFTTAGFAGAIALTSVGGEPVRLLLGPAQSLALLGLSVAALAGAVLVRWVRIPATVLALAGAAVLVAPVAVAPLVGTSTVAVTDGRTLPALAQAQGRAAQQLGTLIIRPLDADRVQVNLVRGPGKRLGEVSTLRMTNPQPSAQDEQLAELAVGFLSAGTTNPTARLHELGIGFVLVQPTPASGGALEQRLITAMTTNQALTQAGQTDEFGTLFQVRNAAETPTDQALASRLRTTNWQDQLGRAVLILQLAVLAFTVILALPTGGLESRARAIRAVGRRHWERLDDDREQFVNATALSNATVEVYEAHATGEHTEGETRD